jgi:hypothetical protein
MMWQYIYALRDPRNKAVRYVGCTSADPSKRLQAHASSSWEFGPKRYWVDELRAEGLKPILQIVDCLDLATRGLAGQPAPELKALEALWISHLLRKGYPLLNIKGPTKEESRYRACLEYPQAASAGEFGISDRGDRT